MHPKSTKCHACSPRVHYHRPAVEPWMGGILTKQTLVEPHVTLVTGPWSLAMILPSTVACSALKLNPVPCMLNFACLHRAHCCTMDAWNTHPSHESPTSCEPQFTPTTNPWPLATILPSWVTCNALKLSPSMLMNTLAWAQLLPPMLVEALLWTRMCVCALF